MKNRIVIYGAGTNARNLIKNGIIRDEEIVLVVDRDKRGLLFGHTIEPVERIMDTEFDQLVITAMNSRLIYEYLTDVIMVDASKIVEPHFFNSEYKIPCLYDNDVVFFLAETEEEYLAYPIRRNDCFVIDFLYQQDKWDDEYDKCNDKKVFVFESCSYEKHRKDGLINHLRGRFPKAVFALWLCDMCDGEYGYTERVCEDYVVNIKRDFDLIYTYHSREARKYGFIFREQIYNEDTSIIANKCDNTVFFMGHAKNRLDLLHKIYTKLTENAVKCDFWIFGVDKNLQLQDSTIHYIDTYVPYREYLMRMSKCSCILEICQKGDETSYRYAEAIIYKKKMISNDASCVQRTLYDSRNICVIQTEEDVDIDWIKKKHVDYDYDNQFDVQKFVEDIRTRMEK